MNRGDRRELIFMDYADRQRFIETRGEVCAKTGWHVHAYVLVPNHFYWVVETPPPNLVAGMKWLLGSYAKRSRSSLLTQPGAYCVSRRQSGFDYPGHPKPEDLRLRRQNASSGHPGINHPCLSVWAKLPAGSSGTWPYLAEMLSPRRSPSRSALHDCRGGLLRCTGKAAGHVPGLRFIKIRESFCDLVTLTRLRRATVSGVRTRSAFRAPLSVCIETWICEPCCNAARFGRRMAGMVPIDPDGTLAREHGVMDAVRRPRRQP
jgi:REP element-mobilizing transposase RayT